MAVVNVHNEVASTAGGVQQTKAVTDRWIEQHSQQSINITRVTQLRTRLRK